MTWRSVCVFLLAMGLGLAAPTSEASDDPTAEKFSSDLAGDISDLLAWTPVQGRLAIAFMVQPLAHKNARFTPEVTRRILLRRAKITGTGADVRLETGDEVRIECNVERAPKKAGDRMRCVETGPVGTRTVDVRIGDEHPGSPSDPIRLFAGVRRDPFFIDILHVREARPRDGERTPPRGPDSINPGCVRTHDLAVVLGVDVASLFGDASGLFAVAGETDENGARRDRIGRPEVTGFILARNWGVPLPGNDVRGLWNREPTFGIDASHLPYFEAAMAGGLARLDKLDRFADADQAKKDDGPGVGPDWSTPHPLQPLLLTDALVVDPSRVCGVNDPTYFEIEMANFRGLPADASGARHHTCGGRTPNHDVVDEVLTLLINGPERVPPGAPLYGPPGAFVPRRSDGIDRSPSPATDTFPYLLAP